MPRVLKAGDEINGYKLTQHLNTGAMANAFAAKAPGGRKVFFKQYKSPAVAVTWFEPYVTYQGELNRRVAQPALKRFCVNQLDSFVHTVGVPTFFQAYEFVEGGHDLESILKTIRKNPTALTWNQKLILAKVMMAGIHHLHESHIVHCDLKPANLQMFVDASIEAGYQLKLIDMDFSVLSDRKAPWHGLAAYVGTPRYFSPEHLRGETPRRASDVFTCGTILYELLCGFHPFPADDDEDYFQKVKADSPPNATLGGILDSKAATEYLAQVLRRCVSGDPDKRPTAKEVSLALNGRLGDATAVLTRVGPAHLKLGAAVLTLNITTAIGRDLLQRFGNEARFADPHQFTLENRESEWWLIPQNPTTNHTLYNGTPTTAPTRVDSGGVIAIGGRASGKAVLPLTIDI